MEKGIPTLLDALDRFPPDLELRVVGDGPLAGLVAERAARDPRLRYDGLQDRDAVLAAMREAAVLAFASEWYEGANPVTIVEAFASGCPVVCCRIGGMATMIEDEVNGLHVEPGDPAALGEALARVATDAGLAGRLSTAGRKDFEDLYTGERTLALLERIYALAIDARRSGGIPELDAELRGERAPVRDTVTV